MEPCCPGCGRIFEPQEFQELLQKEKEQLSQKREGLPEATR
jgi:hypothetical protein